MTSTEPPAIFHVTHQRAGSQWIYKILDACAHERIVPPRGDMSQFLVDPVVEGAVYPTLYVTREQFESVALPARWRRFVVIRDPRDVLVSGYFSLKASHAIMNPRMAGMRRELERRDVEQGLIWLIENWIGGLLRIQAEWISADVEPVRFEDLLEHDVEVFERVLIDRCELPVARSKLRAAVEACRFERLTGGRRPGTEDPAAHERKGIAGDWRNHFSAPVKERFKARWGKELVGVGYETGLDW